MAEAVTVPEGEDGSFPFPGFAFYVQFSPRGDLQPRPKAPDDERFPPFGKIGPEIAGGFSEISGLEASMEAKSIKVGGRNYGPLQRPGPVTFATVVFKRGVIQARHLWKWWALFAGADSATNGGWAPSSRCDVVISLLGGPRGAGRPDGVSAPRTAVMGWKLENAMPVKFRVGDLNARGTEVLIEELHVVHEGLHMQKVT